MTGASETDHLTRVPDGHTRANAATRLDSPERWRAMGCGGLNQAGAPPDRVAWEERGSSHALRAYAVGRATKP